MELSTIPLEVPQGGNVIVGQAHFIKTVDDLHEAVATTGGPTRFGLAFNEASGPCLIRRSGTDPELVDLATRNAESIGAGHVFVLVLGDGYPIQILNALKHVPEVCTIFCATANPVEILVAETDLGRGVLGVVDGLPPAGVETDADVAARRALLRTLGYKL
jgi:adenosine/AMP kinase